MNVTTVVEYANATTTRVVSVERIAHKLAGVPAWMMRPSYRQQMTSSSVNPVADARVCKRGCGKLYLDWYGEMVCPICGYHEYKD
jgi:hypothetical protein